MSDVEETDSIHKTHIACGRNDDEDAALDQLLLGSDILKDVEGCGERTAVFLWNYDSMKMRGVFSGMAPAGPITNHGWRDAPFDYAVRHEAYKTREGLTGVRLHVTVWVSLLQL